MRDTKTISCPNCGKVKVMKTKWAKYCSPACRVQLSRRKEGDRWTHLDGTQVVLLDECRKVVVDVSR